MAEFATTPPIPYVPIEDQAALVRSKIDAAQLSAANSFGGLQKLAIPGPFATDAEANTGGVPDDNLYYKSDGTVRAASHISLDLAFALDKTLTARTGPTPTFSRASSGLFGNANGILVGKTAGTTVSLDPTATTVGTTQVTVTVASGSVVGWLVGQSVSLIVDSNANNAPDTVELWLVGDIVSMTATQLVFKVTSKGTTSASATDWTLGYRGARFDHDATGASKGLLIEESRTNFYTWSEKVDDASWTKTFCTIDPDVISAPNGLIVADKIVEDTSLNFHGIRKNTTVATNTAFISSIYLKAGGRNFAVIYTTGPTARGRFLSIPADGTGAVLGNVTATDAVVTLQYIANGWYRATIEVNSGAGISAPIEVYPAISGTNASYLGDGVSGVFVWGAQLEAGAFATSYIPTTIGTAARSADVCSITGTAFSSFYNQPEGSVVINGDSWNGTAPAWCGFNTGAINRVFEFVKSGSDLTHIDSNAGPTIIKYNPTFPNKFGYARGKAGGYGSFNGVILGTSGIIPLSASPNQLQIGLAGSSGAGYLNGCIKSLTYYRKQLSTLKLQTITT